MIRPGYAAGARRHPKRHHILQACEAVHEPRCSRHNFIAKSIVTKLQSRNPDAGISTDRLLVTGDGTRLRPDIVVDLKEKTFILDVAVAWDARTETLEAMCAHKRQKYASLLPVIRERRPNCEVKVLGLAFFARGLICQSTKQAAKEIGLREGELAWYWRAQNPGETHLERLGDAVRFALLWKYGGAYVDLDIVLKKPLTKLRNCVGEEREPPIISGSLLIFERGHPLMEMCMEEMARQYHGSRLLLHSVSEAIARSLRDRYVCERHDSEQFAPARELRCADGRSRVTVLPLEVFFDARNRTRRVAAAESVRNFIIGATARSYVERAGHHSELVVPSERAIAGSPLGSEARRYCPRTNRLAKKGARAP
ncbi:hypothetical protein HPB52_021586 [Rhipicephalus sanguineus]|uniref:Alpha 1,4-glycosyltransferase domain-containing protein n=1 Tax=Rhipicephalus sanguineus TaxID=34632 RepID=A0A9D4T4E3_RHISA|nr:hypothetical protein HPB52_021586 [Rhipicephalus sanguineus]